MTSRFRSMLAAMALSLMLALPAAAAPPETIEERFTIIFPDVERELVIFVNTTREDYCTADVVDWELAVIQWIIGGEVGPFPDDPPSGFPEGNDPIVSRVKETGQGALIAHRKGVDMNAEIWPMIDDAPLVGPCTDTDPSDTQLVGTADWSANDNDVDVSGTRGNSFGDRGTIKGRDASGKPFKYSWRFHVNDRCYVPEDGPPACLIETSSFSTH